MTNMPPVCAYVRVRVCTCPRSRWGFFFLFLCFFFILKNRRCIGNCWLDRNVLSLFVCSFFFLPRGKARRLKHVAYRVSRRVARVRVLLPSDLNNYVNTLVRLSLFSLTLRNGEFATKSQMKRDDVRH